MALSAIEYEHLKPGDLLTLDFGTTGTYWIVKKTDSKWTHCGTIKIKDKTSALFIDRGIELNNSIVLCNTQLITLHRLYLSLQYSQRSEEM